MPDHHPERIELLQSASSVERPSSSSRPRFSSMGMALEDAIPVIIFDCLFQRITVGAFSHLHLSQSSMGISNLDANPDVIRQFVKNLLDLSIDLFPPACLGKNRGAVAQKVRPCLSQLRGFLHHTEPGKLKGQIQRPGNNVFVDRHLFCKTHGHRLQLGQSTVAAITQDAGKVTNRDENGASPRLRQRPRGAQEPLEIWLKEVPI